jgi:hypothetical protein
MALEEKKLPVDFVVDEPLAQTIKAKLTDEKLACQQAFSIAKSHNVSPLLIGQTADVLNIHLTRCQLGLFGYPNHTKGWDAAGIAEQDVPEGLKEAINTVYAAQKQLPCINLWEIAAQFNISKMQVAYAADQMGLRISPCQLGAF